MRKKVLLLCCASLMALLIADEGYSSSLPNPADNFVHSSSSDQGQPPIMVVASLSANGLSRTMTISATENVSLDSAPLPQFGVFAIESIDFERFKNVIKDDYIIAYENLEMNGKKRSLIRLVKEGNHGTFSLDPIDNKAIRIDAKTVKMLPTAMKKGTKIIAKGLSSVSPLFDGLEFSHSISQSPLRIENKQTSKVLSRTITVSAAGTNDASVDSVPLSWFSKIQVTAENIVNFNRIMRDGYVIAYENYVDGNKKRSLIRPMKEGDVDGLFSLEPIEGGIIGVDARTLKMLPSSMKAGAQVTSLNHVQRGYSGLEFLIPNCPLIVTTAVPNGPKTITISATGDGEINDEPISWFTWKLSAKSMFQLLLSMIKENYMLAYENKEGVSFVRIVKKGDEGTFSLATINKRIPYIDRTTIKMLPPAMKEGGKIRLNDLAPGALTCYSEFLSPIFGERPHVAAPAAPAVAAPAPSDAPAAPAPSDAPAASAPSDAPAASAPSDAPAAPAPSDAPAAPAPSDAPAASAPSDAPAALAPSDAPAAPQSSLDLLDAFTAWPDRGPQSKPAPQVSTTGAATAAAPVDDSPLIDFSNLQAPSTDAPTSAANELLDPAFWSNPATAATAATAATTATATATDAAAAAPAPVNDSPLIDFSNLQAPSTDAPASAPPSASNELLDPAFWSNPATATDATNTATDAATDAATDTTATTAV